MKRVYDPVLRDLAEEVAAVANSSEHLQRRRMWRALHELQSNRTLVSYAMYTHVWEREIAPLEEFVHQGGLARALEVQLRAKLWKAANIPDDEPCLPTVWLPMPHLPNGNRLWGMPLESKRTDPLGSYKPMPPLQTEEDLERLQVPRYEECTVEAERLRDEAVTLLDGRVPVKFHTDELHYGPFEWAVRLRGMDNLLYDVVDRPEFVHRLMGRITEGMMRYHKEREAANAVDAEASWQIHMHWDHAHDGPGMPETGRRLRDCWIYAHAQSAAALSPAMYAEFVHPYNCRMAALFGKTYYHGCEDLSRKCMVIRDLPNLRLFHVSPWTPVEPVVDCFGDRVALEVHSHPAEVLFSWTAEEIRNDLAERHRQAASAPHVLKLCDVETVGDRTDQLRVWASIAREIAEG